MKLFVKIFICCITLFNCKSDEITTKGLEFYQIENPTNIQGCEEFDITLQKIKPTAMISDKDILSYEWNTHTIILKESAYNNLKEFRVSSNIAIYPLIITLNGEKIYGLWYKYAILSQGCRTTLITESDYAPQNGKMNFSIIHGQVYDRSKLGKDPRGDKRIYDYLKSTGRLVE
jgi:hypothetical protein